MFKSSDFEILKKSLEQDYLGYLQDLRSNLDEISRIDYLSDQFVNELNYILLSPQLNKFSSSNFYFINLLEDLSFVIECISEEDEDCLIDFFTHSYLTKDFIDLSQSINPLEAAQKLIEKMEDNIISVFALKIDDTKTKIIKYNLIPEMADFKRIYKSDFKSYYENVDDHYSSEINLKISINEYSPLSTNNILFIPRDNFSSDLVNKQFKNFNEALDVIKDYSPTCYSCIQSFTKVVIPIDEPGIVSYSIQELPGYSCINMFERDFIDLIDDIVHENGHHYLNYHLNQKELIIEDDEKIFFSPWRDALRPIRGIYHAYLTFYWAYKLFKDLNANIHKIDFSPEQQSKVQKRLAEEEQMLKASKKEIIKAYELGKITDDGMKLVESFEKSL